MPEGPDRDGGRALYFRATAPSAEGEAAGATVRTTADIAVAQNIPKGQTGVTATTAISGNGSLVRCGGKHNPIERYVS
ncbi:hypothetical protein Psuf_007080 [Phytohabitans suffuscus]|uniref:Uncharacterized protein n=1 Tax=Phytohabitans suffuscus TaxID=624315 RepID=A0A6F8YBB4_9ACTN|nr:hypothetical protein Psuf_007080 [Phytohabitans suffuscus]